MLGARLDEVMARQESELGELEELRGDHAALERALAEEARCRETHHAALERALAEEARCREAHHAALERALAEEARCREAHHAALEQALAEEARCREAHIESQLNDLRGELRDMHLAQQRTIEEEAHRRGLEVEARLGDLRRQLEDFGGNRGEIARRGDELRNLFAVTNARERASVEKTHGIAEAVLRLEVGAKQLANRVHVVERILSLLFPAARYVSRMRHSVRRRLAQPRSSGVGPAAYPAASPANGKIGPHRRHAGC